MRDTLKASLVCGLMCAGVLVLAGCEQIVPSSANGSLSSGGNGVPQAQRSASPTPQATATAAAAKNSQANSAGCSASQAPADAASFAPNVTISSATAGGEGMDAPIDLLRGQRLEIHLSPAVRWRLTTDDAGHILSPASVQGWYSQQLHACVWRFTAVGTGSAQLAFGGTFTCQPGVHCVYVAMAQDFIVSVR